MEEQNQYIEKDQRKKYLGKDYLKPSSQRIQEPEKQSLRDLYSMLAVLDELTLEAARKVKRAPSLETLSVES